MKLAAARQRQACASEGDGQCNCSHCNSDRSLLHLSYNTAYHKVTDIDTKQSTAIGRTRDGGALLESEDEYAHSEFDEAGYAIIRLRTNSDVVDGDDYAIASLKLSSDGDGTCTSSLLSWRENAESGQYSLSDCEVYSHASSDLRLEQEECERRELETEYQNMSETKNDSYDVLEPRNKKEIVYADISN